MTNNITAEIVSIGTEILLGELTDTNSVYLARTLRDLGINIFYMTSVGDNEARIVNALQIAMSRADVIITCGGLGPTVDDMTRQSVATATNRELVFHQNLLDQIRARFEGFRVKMTENNKRQAYLPDNAIVIENPVGTAPSFIVEHQENVVVSLPGVPREMKYLMTNSVVSYLRDKYQLGIIKAKTLKTAGIGESSLDDLLGNDLLNSSNPSIGLAAHSGQIDIRITAKAESPTVADKMINIIESSVREQAGDFIFGSDEDTLERVIIDVLDAHGETITIIEAGLGGEIAKSLHNINPEIVSLHQSFHSPDAIMAQYPFNADTVSGYASQLAAHIHSQNEATVTIIVLCQPDVDDNDDASEATVVVVRSKDKVRQRVYGFGGQSELAKRWVTTWSLASAWRLLKEIHDDQNI